jgi:hypothetical protein
MKKYPKSPLPSNTKKRKRTDSITHSIYLPGGPQSISKEGHSSYSSLALDKGGEIDMDSLVVFQHSNISTSQWCNGYNTMEIEVTVLVNE